MFYTNHQVTKVSMKELALKAKSELLVTLFGNKTPNVYRVLNNDEGVLVIQDVDCAYNVPVLDNSVEVLYQGSKSLKCSKITTSWDAPITVNANCGKFVYQKEVTSTVTEDTPIAIGDELTGYIDETIYVRIIVAAVSDTQLVLNCFDTKTESTFFAILDKNTLNSAGSWKIYDEHTGKILLIDSHEVRWNK